MSRTNKGNSRRFEKLVEGILPRPEGLIHERLCRESRSYTMEREHDTRPVVPSLDTEELA